MSYDDYPLQEGEYPLLQTKRRTEWGMALLCLISALVIVWMVWNAGLWAMLIGCTVSAALLYYGIRLIMAGRHDWAQVTDRRIIVCNLDFFLLKEKIRECPLKEIKSYRLYGSSRSERKQTMNGELELLLQNGKHFSVPPLEEMKSFLEAMRRGSDRPD